jgi:hypothetical protein
MRPLKKRIFKLFFGFFWQDINLKKFFIVQICREKIRTLRKKSIFNFMKQFQQEPLKEIRKLSKISEPISAKIFDF